MEFNNTHTENASVDITTCANVSLCLTSAYSMMVMQLLLSTFCAGSCPVARNTAVTMLAAWALNPPMDPVEARVRGRRRGGYD